MKNITAAVISTRKRTTRVDSGFNREKYWGKSGAAKVVFCNYVHVSLTIPIIVKKMTIAKQKNARNAYALMSG